jgi:hypothetical protein
MKLEIDYNNCRNKTCIAISSIGADALRRYKVHVCDTSDGLDHIIGLEDRKDNILIIKLLKKRWKFYLKNGFTKINVNMPKLWIKALDNYTKHNGLKNRSDTIWRLFYPAFLEELKLLDPSVNIEPIKEHKKIVKKYSVPKIRKKITSFSNFIIERPEPQKPVRNIEPEPDRNRNNAGTTISSKARNRVTSSEAQVIPRNLGYRKPKKKKEKKPSVPRSLPKSFILK